MANKNKRARAERRRAKRAAKRRRERDDRRTGGGNRLHYVGGHGGTADGLYDDCPMCRAMRFAGIVPDANGVAEVTPAQQKIYERKVVEIVAAEGWPEKAVAVDEEELLLRHVVAMQIMGKEGWPDDPAGLPPKERGAFFARYSQLVRGDLYAATAN